MARSAWRQCALLGALAAIFWSAPAAAGDCERTYGACIDGNALSLTPGAARLLTLPRPLALPAGRVSLAVSLQALYRVLRVDLPGPSADGREVSLVSRSFEQDTLLAVGLGHALEISAVLPVVLWQRGAGPDSLRSQAGSQLPSTATRDPRLALAFAYRVTSGLGLKPRLELSLPLGDREAFASNGGLGFNPTLPIEWEFHRLSVAAALGLRLRPTTELGTLRWGSQALFALGSSFEVWPHHLALGLEAFVLPSLIDSASSDARRLGIRTSAVQSEWLGSLRGYLDRTEAWSAALALGGGLPTFAERSGGVSQSFVAPTSPGVRWLLELRYTPSE